MNRLRIMCALLSIAGLLYAGAGVFESLWHFGVGVSIAGLGIVLFGLVDAVEDSRIRECRERVWQRRDEGVNQ